MIADGPGADPANMDNACRGSGMVSTHICGRDQHPGAAVWTSVVARHGRVMVEVTMSRDHGPFHHEDPVPAPSRYRKGTGSEAIDRSRPARGS
jgi:hypothetical protein